MSVRGISLRTSGVVTPGENDAWVAKTDHLPRITFDAPTDKGQAKGIVVLDTETGECRHVPLAGCRPLVKMRDIDHRMRVQKNDAEFVAVYARPAQAPSGP